MNKEQVKDQLLQAIKASDQRQTASDYSRLLAYDSAKDFTDFVNLIAELERQHEIVILEDGALDLAQDYDQLTGRLSVNKKGFGFVSVENLERDIFIPAKDLNGGMNGDTVQVEITQEAKEWEDKSAEGKISQILDRANQQVVGEFYPFSDDDQEKYQAIGYIKPLNHSLGQMTCLVTDQGLKPVEGEIVRAEIVDYPTAKLAMTCRVLVKETVGHKDAPGTDILAVLAMFDIPHEFPQEVVAEAEAVSETISPDDLARRMDLRDQLTITIDGADAKDLDDAISLKPLDKGGYELGVHIADVSYYVKEGSAIDQEAFDRGTSVYLTDRVVPMLPQRLSNGICSLQEGVDRLAMSCLMTLSPQGKVTDYQIGPSVIQSDHRMTYSDVNAILAGQDQILRDQYQDILAMLEGMADLHHILEGQRKHRGAIDFDTSEAKIIVDETGFPVDIQLRERGLGERMIESFMLAANETVARHYTQAKKAFIYRVHEQPDMDRMQNFLQFVTAMGVKVKGTSSDIAPKELQEILKKIEGESYEPVVKMMMLRSMQQAHYDTEALGHFGLAAEDYTHFTSPIRRYPDLIVHRLIRQYANHEHNTSTQNNLGEIAEQSSKRERRSVDAEREVDSLKKTEFMLDKVGETFPAIISSVTNFGLFVQLENTIEGMIHVSSLKDDYYNFIESHLVLIGERTGRSFKIGDPIQVKLINADVDSRQLDFRLVEEEADVEEANGQPSDRKKPKKKGKSHKAKPKDFKSSKKDKKGQPKKKHGKGKKKKRSSQAKHKGQGNFKIRKRHQ
ncbi:ribonuclease R [Aerococcus sanguinicola]|uniref:Ribonuclease R n=1 Tax=Aerococcus sanguinicola TaxID=119206 RepID=A0A5N1GNJ2_9LACT|nr:ribonuclease R [Aerococcus sanguinicola]KAA9301808.1 ribonuclease R [Aerococcus sanguinicola]